MLMFRHHAFIIDADCHTIAFISLHFHFDELFHFSFFSFFFIDATWLLLRYWCFISSSHFTLLFLRLLFIIHSLSSSFRFYYACAFDYFRCRHAYDIDGWCRCAADDLRYFHFLIICWCRHYLTLFSFFRYWYLAIIFADIISLFSSFRRHFSMPFAFIADYFRLSSIFHQLSSFIITLIISPSSLFRHYFSLSFLCHCLIFFFAIIFSSFIVAFAMMILINIFLHYYHSSSSFSHYH